MERRNLALLCAGVLCFWLFALAFGTAEGRGVAVQAELPTAAPAAVEDVPVVDAAAQPQLSLNCRAAILVDQDTGTVLYEKNADEQVPIASITKVMTLLLTFEAIHNGQLTLETTVPVSEHAYHMGGSQIWLEPGEQFTLDEMIKAICVSSANDAAVAVAPAAEEEKAPAKKATKKPAAKKTTAKKTTKKKAAEEAPAEEAPAAEEKAEASDAE